MRRVLFAAVGACLIAAGLLWLRGNEQESDAAAAEAALALPVLRQQITESREGERPSGPEQSEMPEIEVDGRRYIGLLEIPALELELPVLSAWSDANGKIAPCRYSGTVSGNDLIICAHNYKSHFGRLPTLSAGDEVIFTDVEETRTMYQITGFDVLPGTAQEEMEAGEWDMTLFTCTAGGKKRYAVRAVKNDTPKIGNQQ